MQERMMTISIPKEFVPKPAVLIEAYKTDSDIIVIGEPEWVKDHDCDEMGCATFSHVILRIPLDNPCSKQG